MTTVLLILRDAPSPAARKGGLYHGIIRQHLKAGLEVYVTSLTPMSVDDAASVKALGAHPLRAEDIGLKPWIGGLRGLQRRLRGKKLRPSDWMLHPKAITHMTERIRPSIVMGIQAYQSGMMARRIAQAAGLPYGTLEDISCYSQGRPLLWSNDVMAQLFKESLVTVCVSNGVHKAICDRLDIDLPQVRIIPNPIPEGFENPPTKSLPGLEEFCAGRFLFAGWTNWRGLKRPDLLIRSFAQVHAQHPETALVLAGPYAPEVPELIAQLKLEDSVKLTGNLPREDIHKLAHACDCCCLPSDFETFGLSMIEALAAGKPVVATRTDGPLDVLAVSEFGLLSDIGDAPQFADNMQRIYVHNDRYDHDMIARQALSLYGEDALSKRWQEIYTALPERPSKS